MNAHLNGATKRITLVTANAISHDFTPYDLILVGDVCYTRGESSELVEHLRTAAVPVLLGDPGRQFLPREDIDQVATYPVETSRELEADSCTQASIWRMAGPKR
jgi:predicted nicotinamide N-methyase